ncbi:MAG: DUF2273 domain-containing protein [Clostridia bacterium]|nr:DUF2273 domain-containing protein [Clostridia bacterium]
MSEKKPSGFFENACKIGTPECAVFFAAAAMVLALLFLAFGFWNTVLVALIMLLGAFLGGVKDKKQWLKNLINRLVPDRNPVPYREQDPEIIRAVRKATGASDADEEAPEAGETPAEEAKETPIASQDEENADQE